jgi:DNA-binding NtrC family response regulator
MPQNQVGQRRYAHHLDKAQGKGRPGQVRQLRHAVKRPVVLWRFVQHGQHHTQTAVDHGLQHTAGQQLPINQVTHKHHEGVLQQAVDRCPITKSTCLGLLEQQLYRSLQR